MILKILFIQDVPLFAQIGDSIIPCGRTPDGSQYVVSWTEDTKIAKSGSHTVKLFDEDGYAALKKV